MSAPRTLGIDIGGSFTKVVALDSAGAIVAELRLPTPAPDPSGQGIVALIAHAAAQFPGWSRVGVVVPGIVDERLRTAVYSANLGWRDLGLARMIEDRLDRGIAFGHDVRAAALAEARCGAAAGSAGTTMFVPVGTGVSAAFILDGRPISGDGWVGEIGQLPVTVGPCAGEPLESVASATAIARRAGLPDAERVLSGMVAGDPAATAAWREAMQALGVALAAAIAVLAPRVTVIGGGLSLAGDALLRPLRQAIDEALGPLLPRPIVRAAALGDRAGALGAALLAQEPA